MVYGYGTDKDALSGITYEEIKELIRNGEYM